MLLTHLKMLQDFDIKRKASKLPPSLSSHGDCFHHVGGRLQSVGMASICHAPQQSYSYTHVHLVRTRHGVTVA